MKNKIVVLILLFVSFSTYAQFMNQNRRGIRQVPNNVNSNQQPTYNFDAAKSIGITIYDIEKAAKKIRLNKSKEEFKKFRSILSKHNKEVEEISRINSFTFLEQKKNVEGAYSLSVESRDFSSFRTAMKNAGEVLLPITKLVEKKEKKLDSILNPVLNDKQFKKWKKYKKTVKEKRS